MKYTHICMDEYLRKDHFEYFQGFAYPYVGLTVNIDITDWLKVIKQYQFPFFHSFLYAATNAANSIPEFRQRIKDAGIIEYEKCLSSYTVALENETYCYCILDTDKPINEYIPYARMEQDKAIKNPSISYSEEVQSLYFVSSLPWLTYTALVQPVPIPADSIPRISWGKSFTQCERTLIPISLLCHHALIDGVHINKFYQNLQTQLDLFCRQIKEDS